MTTKINIFGLMLLLVFFTCVGLYFGYLIGDRSATDRYEEMYLDENSRIDSMGVRVDAYSLKLDTLENLIDKNCSEKIKTAIRKNKAKRYESLLQENSLLPVIRK